jgi:hypothetical protein
VEGPRSVVANDAPSNAAVDGRRQAEAMRGAIVVALEDHRVEHGSYPPRFAANDPWGRAFLYQSDGATYRLVSSGEDGRFGTVDDIGGRP